MDFLNKMDKRLFKKLIIVAVVFALVIGSTAFLLDYYRADTAAIDAFLPIGDKINETNRTSGVITFEAPGSDSAVIFYPGGKVEYTAYVPLMRALAAGGVTAILVDMPFNLAVFNPMRADGIKELYPDIQNWYMAGHSLGGSMASSYISTHTAEFKGLILLASYSITDLRDSGISVLSIYGSNDGVMNMDSYEDNKVNLPHGFTERVIEGGNHAYFGMYGEQVGDGVASVSNTEQINTSANLIIDFIK